MHLTTQLDQEKDTEWCDKHGDLLNQAEVVEAEALFLYCLKLGEKESVTAETLCSKARSVTETAIFDSMYQPL